MHPFHSPSEAVYAIVKRKETTFLTFIALPFLIHTESISGAQKKSEFA